MVGTYKNNNSLGNIFHIIIIIKSQKNSLPTKAPNSSLIKSSTLFYKANDP